MNSQARFSASCGMTGWAAGPHATAATNNGTKLDILDELKIKTHNCETPGWATRAANEIERLRKVEAAAQNLCRVRGRYHSEQAMRQLMVECGIETPNAKGSEGENERLAAAQATPNEQN